MAKTISATTAARTLSDILDAVEHVGEEFVVKRHGRVVARIAPVRAVPRITWGELRERMKDWPKPDPGFAADLRRMRRAQPRLPKDPWARSSIRRS